MIERPYKPLPTGLYQNGGGEGGVVVPKGDSEGGLDDVIYAVEEISPPRPGAREIIQESYLLTDGRESNFDHITKFTTSQEVGSSPSPDSQDQSAAPGCFTPLVMAVIAYRTIEPLFSRYGRIFQQRRQYQYILLSDTVPGINDYTET